MGNASAMKNTCDSHIAFPYDSIENGSENPVFENNNKSSYNYAIKQ